MLGPDTFHDMTQWSGNAFSITVLVSPVYTLYDSVLLWTNVQCLRFVLFNIAVYDVMTSEVRITKKYNSVMLIKVMLQAVICGLLSI